jgi:hypothetical protein
MNCPECLDLLQRRLDGEVLAECATVDSHLAECPECRARHAAVQQLVDGIRLLPRPMPPVGLGQRIAGQALFDLDKRRAVQAFRRRLTIAGSIAASLLVAGVTAFSVYTRAQIKAHEESVMEALADRQARDGSANKKVPAAPATDPSFDETLNEASTAAFALTRRAANQTVARAQQWLPRSPALSLAIAPLKAGETLGPVLGPLSQTLRQAGESVAKSLQPITASAPRALHTCTDFVEMFLQESRPPQPATKS